MTGSLENHKRRHDFAFEAVGFAAIRERIVPGDIEVNTFMTGNTFFFLYQGFSPLAITAVRFLIYFTAQTVFPARGKKEKRALINI